MGDKYAVKISGYGGEKYALFVNGQRTGTSTLAGGDDEKHRAELRLDGYKIKGGLVKE